MTAPTPRFLLLGGIALDGVSPDAANAVLTQSKVVGLLAILLLSPDGTYQRRDRIVGWLWPELDQAHARTALRKAVHLARSVFGETVIGNRGDEELVLTSGAIGCDVHELRDAGRRGHLARAVELYRGPLMPGFHLSGCHDFDAWLEDQRTELHETTVRACLELARLLAAEANATEAANYARKAARLAGPNERVLRRSLVMLDRFGDRAGALRLYEEFVQRLRRDLEADPSAETVAMGDALRAGRPLS